MLHFKKPNIEMKYPKPEVDFTPKRPNFDLVFNPPNFWDDLIKYGLIAYYPFDGDVNDHSENGNDGTIYGDPQFVEGVRGQALSFDGVHDEVKAGSIFTPNQFTISFWLQGNLQETGQTYPGPIQFGRINFWARIPHPDFGVRVDDLDGNDVRGFLISDTNFPEMTLITAVLDRGNHQLRLYENAVLAGAVDVSNLGDISLEPSPINFGNSNDYCPCIIDQVRIYNRALSDLEIQKLYDLKV